MIWNAYNLLLARPRQSVYPLPRKDLAFYAVDIFRLENGKLAKHWDATDVHGPITQQGMID